jgi:hypothetical protein
MIYARLLAACIAFGGQTFTLQALRSGRPRGSVGQALVLILQGRNPVERVINPCKASTIENEKLSC